MSGILLPDSVIAARKEKAEKLRLEDARRGDGQEAKRVFKQAIDIAVAIKKDVFVVHYPAFLNSAGSQAAPRYAIRLDDNPNFERLRVDKKGRLHRCPEPTNQEPV